MYIPGHLGVAYLLARTRGARAAAVRAACLGALSPDLVDKPLRLMGWTPHGRSIGHSVWWWLMLGVVALYLVRAEQHENPCELSRGPRHLAVWFILGGMTHLGADLINDLVAGILYTRFLFSAWFGFPLWTPDDGHVIAATCVLPCKECVTPLEVAVACAALALLARQVRGAWTARARRHDSPAAGAGEAGEAGEVDDG